VLICINKLYYIYTLNNLDCQVVIPPLLNFISPFPAPKIHA
jgi:hypothetical protein